MPLTPICCVCGDPMADVTISPEMEKQVRDSFSLMYRLLEYSHDPRAHQVPAGTCPKCRALPEAEQLRRIVDDVEREQAEMLLRHPSIPPRKWRL